MEFRETLLAAQRNQQQKSSDNSYYKARFDPPKKEQKQRDRLSANIQKFLAKKDEEEKIKQKEVQKKKDDLLAMRDPKALRKIQKTLKVIKSANKAAILDAVDNDNTAVTLTGPDQPDQDDYGYESQEAAALYAKMMQKYSKLPDEPKFPTGNQTVKRDLNGTRERVKHALQTEDEPVPHKRRRRTDNSEREQSPPTRYEPEKEKRKDELKSDKPKPRRPAPPPMDFNQLLKLAEQKKSEPVEAAQKKALQESEKERLMTKKQKREYEEEMARRQRRQERIDAEAARGGKPKHPKEDRPMEKERKPEPGGLGRIPKLSDKNNSRNDSPKPDRDRERLEKIQREKERNKIDRERNEREKERLEKDRLDKERLDKLRAERERIDRDIARLNIDRERLDKAKTKLETRTTDKPSKPVDNGVDRPKLGSRENVKKNIDLKSQNTYRIHKNSNENKLAVPNKNSNGKYLNGHNSQGKPVPKPKEQVPQRNGIQEKEKEQMNKHRVSDIRSDNGKRLPDKEISKRPDDRKVLQGNPKMQPGSSKPKPTSSFDFDKHINSLGKNGHANKNGIKKPDGMKKRPQPDDRKKQKRRAVDSDSEYDSELDDFIDDGEEDMDYSRHIKEIFGYDKSKYRDMDDDDDPDMESSFARQQREEYISKKIGIMEDLEDMRMEAMMKKKTKKGRRISDDD